jgi:hypothetical protein
MGARARWVVADGLCGICATASSYANYKLNEKYQRVSSKLVSIYFTVKVTRTPLTGETSWQSRMQNRKRGERLQIMLLEEEFRALDDFRFSHRMPSRAAAIREVLRRGLGVKEEKSATAGTRSSDFGVLLKKSNHRKRDGAA